MKAAAKPTDHLLKELFGSTLMGIMLSYAIMWVEVNVPVRVCQRLRFVGQAYPSTGSG